MIVTPSGDVSQTLPAAGATGRVGSGINAAGVSSEEVESLESEQAASIEQNAAA